jgi:hypothetical protein
VKRRPCEAAGFRFPFEGFMKAAAGAFALQYRAPVIQLAPVEEPKLHDPHHL